MGTLTLSPESAENEQIEVLIEKFIRRIETNPPGTCPLTMYLSLLQTGAAQTCGKCVPCRDGLPQLAKLFQRIIDCKADQETFEEFRALAETINDGSDCAIGYESARMVLESIERYPQEYESHINKKHCVNQGGQKLPCEALCPAHVNVPGYIAFTGLGRFEEAVQLVRKDNPFVTACALICEHPCEERCRRQIIDAPISIRGIKRHAVDQCPTNVARIPQRGPDTGRRIAVIGGGPAGMSCAYFLALMGHSVVVFEARQKLGGMMRYGIPAYRFPRHRLDEDLEGILQLDNIEIRCNTEVDAQLMQSITQEFDAVFVSIGAHGGKALRMENVEAEGVSYAVDLLREIGDGAHPDFTGKKVVIIGGGNVAMDCARTSVRLGAEEVSVVYRRRFVDMTAMPEEVASAIAEGIEMVTLESPVAVEVNEDGHCSALITQPQITGVVKHDRPSPRNAKKPQKRWEADIILLAVGQDVLSQPFEDCGMAVKRGTFVTDDTLAAQNMPGVFVGGDCQSGPTTVIKAVGAGKLAARNIDAYLGYDHKLDNGPIVPPPTGSHRTPMGRVHMAERPARERRVDFDITEIAMSEEEVMQECGRCLRCDHYGCGVVEGGRVQYV